MWSKVIHKIFILDLFIYIYYTERRRSKSSSHLPTESTVAVAAQQAPLYHLLVDRHLPITTSSVHISTESYLSSTTFTDRFAIPYIAYDN